MKKELTYLGIGLLFSLSSLIQSENLIPWKLQLLFGLTMMGYSTYLIFSKHERKKVFQFLVPAWTIFMVAGIVTLTTNKSSDIIYGSDLLPAENFEEIRTCEEGKERALKDIEEGKLRYIFGSFGSRQPLAKNLKKNYGIEIIEVNGVLGIPNTCYNQIMHEEIQKRYGQVVFNKAYE